jgi:hypothetical protein
MNEIVEEHEIDPTDVAVVIEEGSEDSDYFDTAASTTELLYSTDDASVWAKEWVRIATEITEGADEGYGVLLDEGWMIGWFANCAENAKAHEHGRIREKLSTLDPALGEEIIESWTLHKLTDETPPTAAELLLVLYTAALRG